MKSFLVLVLLLLPVAIWAQSGTDVQNLITKLFTTDGYNKKIRPLTDQTQPVIMLIDFYLNSIIEFDELEESLTTSGYLSIQWVDEYLVWSSATYNGVALLFLPQDDIWKPDMSLRNSYKSFTGLGSSYLNLLISEDGHVQWNPFQVLTSTCSVDITYFPFDTQSCDLKFTAWSYTKAEVELNLGSKGIEIEEYSDNAAWELVSTSSREVNTEEAAVIFNIKLKRKPLYYLLNILAPVIMLTVLNALTFVLPVTSGERAGYSITVFLSLAVFLTIVTAELPKNSDTTSLVGVYLMLMSSMSTMLVAVSLLEIRLANRDAKSHPINRFYCALYTFTLVLRCKSSCKSICKKKVEPESATFEPNIIMSKSIITSSEVSAEDEDITWIDVVNALDILFFWCCILFSFLSTTILANMAIKNYR